MASSNQQQNVNTTGTPSTHIAPTNVASATVPPPRYTMNPDDRVRQVYTILSTARMADPKSFTQLEAGVYIVDMCTYNLDTLTSNPFVRRRLFESAEAAVEMMALSVIDRIGLDVDIYPAIDELERAMHGNMTRTPTPVWSEELQRRFVRISIAYQRIKEMRAGDRTLLGILPRLLLFVSGGDATLRAADGTVFKSFDVLVGPQGRSWQMHMAEFGTWCLVLAARYISRHFRGQTIVLFGKHIPVENFAG